MTRETFRIVEGRILNRIFVRIVTSSTTETCIIRIVTPTGEQTIGLKAHSDQSLQLIVCQYLLRAVVTRATEFLPQLISFHLTWIEDVLIIESLCFHRHNVIAPWAMAGLASYTGDQTIKLQLKAIDCRG